MAMRMILAWVLALSGAAHENAVTTGGIKYGMENRLSGPQPVLFVFALDIAATLNPSASYNEVGRALYGDNFLIVSLDLPAHGDDDIPGQPSGLFGWCYRIEQGIDVSTYFAERAKAVLNDLISKGYADPTKVYAAGTSRGGFMALQFADQDTRVRGVAAFCPVTRLGALSEFANFAGSPSSAALSSMVLVHSSYRLAGKKLRLYSGPEDTRVGTCWAVDFMRVVNTVSTTADAQLLIQPAANHNTPVGAHVHAAAWLRTQP